MGKDKKGKKATSAPKESAKIAKGLRKAGKAALKLASQPAVSEAVAGAMLAAAAALRKPPKPREGAGAAGAAEGLGDTLRAIAVDVARRAVEGLEEPARKPNKKKAAAAAPKA
jgi:hypothetical protein